MQLSQKLQRFRACHKNKNAPFFINFQTIYKKWQLFSVRSGPLIGKLDGRQHCDIDRTDKPYKENNAIRRRFEHETHVLAGKRINFPNYFLDMSPKKHLIQQWSSMLLMILVGFQIIALFQTHILIFRLTLCDTILLVIVHGYRWMDNSLPGLQLFLRLAALVTFEALIFVNSTHALETLFCEESHMHFSSK